MPADDADWLRHNGCWRVGQFSAKPSPAAQVPRQAKTLAQLCTDSVVNFGLHNFAQGDELHGICTQYFSLSCPKKPYIH